MKAAATIMSRQRLTQLVSYTLGFHLFLCSLAVIFYIRGCLIRIWISDRSHTTYFSGERAYSVLHVSHMSSLLIRLVKLKDQNMLPPQVIEAFFSILTCEKASELDPFLRDLPYDRTAYLWLYIYIRRSIESKSFFHQGLEHVSFSAGAILLIQNITIMKFFFYFVPSLLQHFVQNINLHVFCRLKMKTWTWTSFGVSKKSDICVLLVWTEIPIYK